MEFLDWFVNPVKNQYVDFTGRTSRKEFWMYVLVYVILYIALIIIGELVGLGESLGILFSLAVLVPSVAITTRRLHDTNLSGWWQLLGLIPFIGWIIVIVLTIRKGEAGANRFGAPAGVGSEAATSDTPELAQTESNASNDATEEDKQV